MFFVYMLKSESDLEQIYIGYTTDIQERIKEHNLGQSKHTSKFKPWKLASCICFDNKEKAIAFGKYLKSHSGRAFIKKHF